MKISHLFWTLRDPNLIDLNCVSSEFYKAILQKRDDCYSKWLGTGLVPVNQMLIIARRLSQVNFSKLQLCGLSHVRNEILEEKTNGLDGKMTQHNSEEVQRKQKDTR